LHGVTLPTSLQTRPAQHASVGEHDWPIALQVAPGSHVPALEPAAIWQRRFAQQSPFALHAAPCGWQAIGAPHMPPVQMPEQHVAAVVHACPFGVHAAASGVPASAPPSLWPPVPPSPAVGGVFAQTKTPGCVEGMHSVPPQQPIDPGGAPTVQGAPATAHVGAVAHTKPPLGDGMQGSRLQH
jgi:hypothetical protein